VNDRGSFVARLSSDSYNIGSDGKVDNEKAIYNTMLEITFPEMSDFLRLKEDAIEGKLKEFMSFHNFKSLSAYLYGATSDEIKATEKAAMGKADELVGELDYEYVKRVANVVTVKLTSKPKDSSDVIMKIDGTKYTFAGNKKGGHKMDLAGRGIAGTAGYDDVYRQIPIEAGPNFIAKADVVVVSRGYYFVEPGNRDWTFNIEGFAVNDIGGGSAETTASLMMEVPIASLSFSPSVGGRVDGAMLEAVANLFKGSLSIEKYADGVWSPVSATINLNLDKDVDDVVTDAYFEISSITVADLVPYRVVWNGTGPVTTAEYFGVAQWIKVLGGNTDNVDSAALYTMSTVSTNGQIAYWDTYGGAHERLRLPKPEVKVYSSDNFGRNVVLEVGPFEGILYSELSAPVATYYRFKKVESYGAGEFLDNFKFGYYQGDNKSPSTTHEYRTDVVYVTIKNYEMKLDPTDTYKAADYMLYLTLDPEYTVNTKTKFLYVSPVICYDDNRSTFGKSANWQFGFFETFTYAATF
jgi:hypothetical protein